MESQERDLITTLLTRLKGATGQPKEPEADAMIRQAMVQLPDAPYYLVQTVLIQDLSLQQAQSRIAQLEQQLAALPPPQSASFLGGMAGRGQQSGSVPPSGPWTRTPQAPPPPQYAQPQYAPPPQQYAQQGYAQQGYAPAGGGMFGGGGNSFLRSAAATAAGVAGGALLFQGISSLFGHSYASGLGGMGGGMGYGGGISETVVNNYGDQGGSGYGGGDYGGGGDYSGGGDYGGGGDSGYDSGGDYGGGDYGGGDLSSC